MDLPQDEAVIVKEDSDKILWRGSRESAGKVADGLAMMNKGQRYSVVKLTTIQTYYHDPLLYREERKVIEFPARPPQPL